MHFLQSLPDQIVCLVSRWLVPLYILYNIVGWAGLVGREANRSSQLPTAAESSALARSLWAAWWVGLLIALVGLSFFCRPHLGMNTQSNWWVTLPPVVGFIAGVVRGVLPRIPLFRNRTQPARRHILAGLVICAVAVSTASGVLYFSPPDSLHLPIASAYMSMLIAYAITKVFEVTQ